MGSEKMAVNADIDQAKKIARESQKQLALPIQGFETAMPTYSADKAAEILRKRLLNSIAWLQVWYCDSAPAL